MKEMHLCQKKDLLFNIEEHTEDTEGLEISLEINRYFTSLCALGVIP